MSESDSVPEADLAALPQLPRVSGKPVFDELWERRVFALAIQLSRAGHFTWKEWVTALSNELDAAEYRNGPQTPTRYYHHWLTALERLVTAKGLVSWTELLARTEVLTENKH